MKQSNTFQKLWVILFLILGMGFQPVRAIEIEVADAPDSNLDLTVAAIASAKSSLLINIYELTSPQIVDAILAQVKAGVKIQILEEGSPVGGLSAAARGVQGQIVQSMKGKTGDLLFEMGGNPAAKRRFHFDHGKYIVVDGASLLIGSENYSPTGNPVPGSKGNRGWEIFIHDPTIAAQFTTLFAGDTDKSYGDVTELTSNPAVHVMPMEENVPVRSNTPMLNASSVEKITSPDDSVAKVVAAIQNAKKTIDIEQMTFDSSWKGSSSSPLYDAVVAAAKRGVSIRVLLNDDRVFDHPGSPPPAVHKNQVTVDAFNALAKGGKLKIAAKIADLAAMGVDYIHNKGMLIDGNETLISSINWDENSFENNRETAVLVASPEVNQFYSNLFSKDWTVSAQKTLLEELTFQCPKKIHLSIQNIQVQISDDEDQDFKSLKNLKVDGDFMAQDSNSCIFEAPERSFFQIRKSSQGVITLVYEGYTPKSAKLFSIRSKLPDAQVFGAHPAGIFDGSGPTRELLGQAVLELKQ